MVYNLSANKNSRPIPPSCLSIPNRGLLALASDPKTRWLQRSLITGLLTDWTFDCSFSIINHVNFQIDLDTTRSIFLQTKDYIKILKSTVLQQTLPILSENALNIVFIYSFSQTSMPLPPLILYQALRNKRQTDQEKLKQRQTDARK